MADDVHIPIVEEQARVTKRLVPTEEVNVHVTPETSDVIVSDEVRRERVDITRIPIGREVGEAPIVRTQGDLTIVPVVEERLVVEKRLFLVEELHLRRIASVEQVELPATLRRTNVKIERIGPDQEEE